MFNHSKDLALFLEQMRVSRGISQEDFTDGIISNRQYQRYVSGSSAMPFHLLDDFAERLNVKKDFILLEFDLFTIKETNNIIEYFNAVNNDQFDVANKIDKDIVPKYILDASNLTYYTYANYLKQFKEGHMSKNQFIDKLKSLIDYPKILNKTAMTMIETSILSNLLDFLGEEEQIKIFKRIKSFIDNPNLVWTGSQLLTYNMILFRIAKYSGVRKDFDSVIYFSEVAIALNSKSKYYVNLDAYYYFLALSYHHKGDMKLFSHNMYKCFTVLELVENTTKTNKYIAMAKEDFNIDFLSFVSKYLIEKYKL